MRGERAETPVGDAREECTGGGDARAKGANGTGTGHLKPLGDPAVQLAPPRAAALGEPSAADSHPVSAGPS